MKWLKMDCDAQENLDMRKLVDAWGWEWYGRYWAILGKVGMLVTESRQTFALQTNNGDPFPVRLLSNDLGTTVERMTDFLSYLADNRLIDKRAWSEKALIYVPKLKDRADEYTKKLLTKSRQTPEQEEEEEVDKKKKENTKDKIRGHPTKLSNPNLDEVKTLWIEREYVRPEVEAEKFFNYYEANGWRVGKNPMKNWKAAAAGWNTRAKEYGNGRTSQSPKANSVVERATFRHGPEDEQRFKNLGESIRGIRNREDSDGKRVGPDTVTPSK